MFFVNQELIACCSCDRCSDRFEEVVSLLEQLTRPTMDDEKSAHCAQLLRFALAIWS